ncbi:MAG: ribosomal protein S18-alanine N-acetyltransferase [Candidatus Eisenbacteria bacterium]|uniref:[Ribosomal protein bS18]-alanine N-acetyltransferase n=1 Tax=Eiseniibacteriota bacterium TaxID=2212470 RepID=A0A956M1B5_UNCEI|nr:ribosomal protein S18-alanine N-acetyltransferase [Candidatus Eisenbacteria bacterium]
METSDLVEVAALEARCFADPWSKALFLAELEEREQNYPRVAVQGTRILGYLISWFVADEVHLGNIAVDPEQRSRGIARMLLEDLIHQAELRGSSYIVLEVRVGNESAIRLYRSYGFEDMALRRGYYQDNGEDALIMIRLMGAEA